MTTRKVVCTSQPQGPVSIDWSNPLNKGLAFALASGGDIDAVSQIKPTLSASSKKGVSSVGVGIAGTGMVLGSELVSFGNAGADVFKSAGTLHVLLTISGNVGIVNRLGVTSKTANSTFGWALTLIYGQPELTVYGSASGLHVLSSQVLQDGKTYLVSVTIPSGLPVASGAHIYVNAVDTTIGSPSGTGTSGTDASVLMKVGGGGNSTNDFMGVISYVSLIRREQTIEEIRAVAANPWQIFQPQKRPIFVGVGGGGPSVYSVDVFESLTAADFFGGIFSVSPNTLETLSAIDVLSSVFSISSSASASASAADQSSYGAVATAATTESSSSADLLAAAGSLSAASSEAAAPGEQSTNSAIFVAAATGASAATESSNSASGGISMVDEPATAGEVSARTSVTSAASVGAATAADAPLSSRATAATAAENSTAGESGLSSAAFSVSIANTLTAGETPSVSAVLSGQSSEPAAPTDYSATDGGTLATISEVLAAAATGSSLAVLGASAAELLSASDYQAGVGLFGRSILEPVSASDFFIALGAGSNGDVYEALSASDSSTPSMWFSRAAVESAPATDSFSSLASQISLAVESVFAADVFSGMQILHVVIDEHGNAIDIQVVGSAGKTPMRRVGTIPARTRRFRW